MRLQSAEGRFKIRIRPGQSLVPPHSTDLHIVGEGSHQEGDSLFVSQGPRSVLVGHFLAESQEKINR